MKARKIHEGDWIKGPGGKPVRVTAARDGSKLGKPNREISWKRGSRSGMMRPDRDAEITRIFSFWGKKS
jgi:hypothetical protein